jgi:hypothetical protein
VLPRRWPIDDHRRGQPFVDDGGVDRVHGGSLLAAHRQRFPDLGDEIADGLGGDAVARLEQPLIDGVAEDRGGGPALVGALAQRLAHQLLQIGIEIGAVLVEAGEAGVAHHQEHVELVGGGEQAAAGEQLGEHDADREQIRALIERVFDDLLGRHVAVLALERAGLGLVRALWIGGAGDAEIDELDVAARGQQHVGGRDVAVDDVDRLAVVVGEVVRVIEGVEHLVADPRGERGIDTAALLGAFAEQGEHVDALDVLHGDEQHVALAGELEGLRDLGVDQARGELGLVDEHRVVRGVEVEVRQQPLDHDLLLEAVLAGRGGDEQLCHSADRQPLDQLISAKRNGKRFGHERLQPITRARACPASPGLAATDDRVAVAVERLLHRRVEALDGAELASEARRRGSTRVGHAARGTHQEDLDRRGMLTFEEGGDRLGKKF